MQGPDQNEKKKTLHVYRTRLDRVFRSRQSPSCFDFCGRDKDDRLIGMHAFSWTSQEST